MTEERIDLPAEDDDRERFPSRRAFLVGAAGLTGVAVAAGAWRSPVGAAEPSQASASPDASASASATTGRSYTSARFLLELDGSAGVLNSAEGGTAVGDVVIETSSSVPPPTIKKHIGGVKYEDITLKTGAAMPANFYDWVGTAFGTAFAPKSGAIAAADYNYKEASRLEFFQALMTEVGFPATDGASKDAAYLTLKFSPEYTLHKAGSGKAIGGSLSKTQQKQWLQSNFRLKIGGLESDCARVSKIEALTIKQKIVEDQIDEFRELDPTTVEWPNLVVTLPAAFSGQFQKWHEDFVITGNNADSNEKGGTLEYLSSDLKTALFTLTFHNLGIFSLRREASQSGSEQIARVKAEMYVEKIEFSSPLDNTYPPNETA